VDQSALYALLAGATLLGFLLGRTGAWRPPVFQNRGEALVSRELAVNFGHPDYHLLNHVTIGMADGTTQIDHILVSRFGVFVIETKDYRGWLFAGEADSKWTQVLFHYKFRFQNPLFQNARHVQAVQELLDFLPRDAVKSVVVFAGEAEFKTATPARVVLLEQLADYIGGHSQPVMSLNRMQFCVGRLETARLALTRETDLAHVEGLARRYGDRGV